MLVSFFLQHIYKHSLLDSGILCCLVHILNALLDPDEANQKQKATDRDELFTTEKDYDGDAGQVRRLEMVANGSLIVFSRHKEGPVLLHSIQLHRHAMQILVLLLVNGNRSTAKHIRKHHLIKVLLMAVKDFNPDCGDSTYTMGIVNLLLEYVEVSCRPEDVIAGHEMLP
ncbi:protein SPIRRIG-like isoform X2 [Pyrus x bretschneideri]|uniref:protein SPIRRIG-like isoform X2 n=1 Tax=Pyrus x bretschneideri TaxID=225117 RepID=UPI00202F2A3E|nr:protein SPIRRIG-like isoform X2 [Pyrus x bretschneideri]